jgi:hypothetical protein
MGYGDLEVEDKDEDFLSQSCVSETDFQLLMKDNFFDIVKEIQADLPQKSITPHKLNTGPRESSTAAVSPLDAMKMPEYDPSKSYDAEFYNLFIWNQQLLEQVEKEAQERNDLIQSIYRISDFYDCNINKLKAERYQNGRKIHERKKMNELERDFECPYDGCGKNYASEGALNLHIKTKHNGGNKTDREKLAKSLVYCKAKGINIPELQVNLPPGIVQKAATQIS